MCGFSTMGEAIALLYCEEKEPHSSERLRGKLRSIEERFPFKVVGEAAAEPMERFLGVTHVTCGHLSPSL